MTNISKEGIQQIRDAYNQAKKKEWDLETEYKKAVEHSKQLLHVVSCPHDELEDASTDGIMRTRCKQCGWVWID
jgi:hypothetical protein